MSYITRSLAVKYQITYFYINSEMIWVHSIETIKAIKLYFQIFLFILHDLSVHILKIMLTVIVIYYSLNYYELLLLFNNIKMQSLRRIFVKYFYDRIITWNNYFPKIQYFCCYCWMFLWNSHSWQFYIYIDIILNQNQQLITLLPHISIQEDNIININSTSTTESYCPQIPLIISNYKNRYFWVLNCYRNFPHKRWI